MEFLKNIFRGKVTERRRDDLGEGLSAQAIPGDRDLLGQEVEPLERKRILRSNLEKRIAELETEMHTSPDTFTEVNKRILNELREQLRNLMN